MQELWQDYVKLKYGGKVKLCFMDKDTAFRKIRKFH